MTVEDPKMCRFRCWVILSACLWLVTVAAAAQDATATCNFDRTNQLAVRYQRIQLKTQKKVLGSEIPYGKVWAPGGKPMTLFSNTDVIVGNHNVPTGAYTLFVIPEEKAWTLIISKSTDMSGKYDESQDLARVPMKYGELSSPEEQFTVYFAHVAPDQCNMRLDLQTARAFISLKKKK